MEGPHYMLNQIVVDVLRYIDDLAVLSSVARTCRSLRNIVYSVSHQHQLSLPS